MMLSPLNAILWLVLRRAHHPRARSGRPQPPQAPSRWSHAQCTTAEAETPHSYKMVMPSPHRPVNPTFAAEALGTTALLSSGDSTFSAATLRYF